MRTELRCFTACVTLWFVTPIIASEKYIVSNRIIVSSVEQTTTLSSLTLTESKDMFAEKEPTTTLTIGTLQNVTISPTASMTPSTAKHGLSSIEPLSDISSELRFYSELETTSSTNKKITSNIEPAITTINHGTDSIISSTKPVSQMKNASAPGLQLRSERITTQTITSANIHSTQSLITKDLDLTSSDLPRQSSRAASQTYIPEITSAIKYPSSLESQTHSLPVLYSSEGIYFTVTDIFDIESSLSYIYTMPLQSTTELETDLSSKRNIATLNTPNFTLSSDVQTTTKHVTTETLQEATTTLSATTSASFSDGQTTTEQKTTEKPDETITTLSATPSSSSFGVQSTTESSKETAATLSTTPSASTSDGQTTTEQETTEQSDETTTILSATTSTSSFNVQSTTKQETTEQPDETTTTLSATASTSSFDVQSTTEQETTESSKETTAKLSTTTSASTSNGQTTTKQETTESSKETTATLSTTTSASTSDGQTTMEQETTENSKETTATLSTTTSTSSSEIQSTTEQETTEKPTGTTTNPSTRTSTSSSEHHTTTEAMLASTWSEPTTDVECSVSSFGEIIGQDQPREGQYAEFVCQWLTNGACDSRVVTWRRDSFTYKHYGRIRIKSEHSSNKTVSALWLLPVKPRDSGKITCSFVNVEQAITVTVLEKPQVIIAPQIVAVELGVSVSIQCNITNAKKANVSSTNITWCVNGTEYTGTNGMTNIRYTDTSSVLTVVASNTNYSCGVMQNSTINELCTNSPVSMVVIYAKENPVCKNDSEAGLHWETTPAGREQITACRKGYDGTARRKCSKGGNWLPPKLLGCVKKAITDALDNLNALEEREGETQEVIDDVLSTLTTSTDDQHGNSDDRLSSGDLSKTTAVLDKILSITPNETSINETTFVGVVNNLLSVKNSDTWKNVNSESGGADSASSIMKTVTTLGKVIANTLDENKTVVVRKENIELEIARITGYLSFVSEQTGDDVTQKIYFNKEGDKTYSAALYKTISSVLPDRAIDTGSKKLTVTSQVLSLDILSDSIPVNRENPVILTFETKRFAKQNNLTEYEGDCVWWDFNLYNGLGGWNSSGCEMLKNTCQCYHLTNFAVLMSPVGLLNREQSERLRIISLIGCCISILSSVVTIIVYVRLWRYVASNRSKLLLNLCAALTIAYILFVAGIDKTDNDDACTAITALMHYFFLSTFFLMLAEGIDILISVVIVFSTTSKLKWLLLMGWGVPMIDVIVTVAIAYQHEYHSQHYCWLTITDGVLYSFVGPVVGIIIINIIILIGVLRALYSAKIVMSRSRKQKIVAGVRSVCILLPVLGITWLFGIMSVNDDLIIFQYLFAVTNSLQGLFIFLFYVVFNKQVRKAINERVKKHEIRTQDSRLLSSKSKKLSLSSTYGNTQDSEQTPKKKLGKQYELYGFNIPRANCNVRLKTYDSLHSEETCRARL